MGSNGSKPNNEFVATQKNDGGLSPSDPRSPTPEISRTPLQDKPGTKHNITKNCDLRKTFDTAANEEKLIHNNPILSAVIKNHLQSYDPRSPTQDFERTPIVVASKIDETKNGRKFVRHLSESCESPQLNNTDGEENFDSCSEAKESSPELVVPKNLCNKFCDMSLNGTIETEEPLGLSTASGKVIQDQDDSPVVEEQKPTILLETNFEYREDVEKFEDSCEDVESPCDSITAEDVKNFPIFKIIDLDPRSPSIGIERTPIVVANVDEGRDSNVEEMSDDSLLKVLQSTNAELRQAISKQNKTEEGLLVYEDETANMNDTPKKLKNYNNGSRTPLSCMRNKDGAQARSKSANMLFDPKNQKVQISKIPKRVSHIPRLKSLSKPTKLIPTGSSISLKSISNPSNIGADCENTPPHSHRDRWDKDNSIIL